MDTRPPLRYGLSVNNLIVKPGFIASLLRAVGLVKVDSDGKVAHNAGADFVEDTAFKSGYDPKAALSALAAFPWPYSCVQAISTDLSKVPLRAYRGRGANAEVLDSHPVLELLLQPSSRVSGVLFRRQLYTDMVLTGNAFILMAGSAGRVDALLRLHPSRVQISPLSDGQPGRYQYQGGEGTPKHYEHEQVLHIRAPSWSDDPTNLWGTGAVQPLHHDLTTEKSQAALAARTAATGQPTGILSPKEEGDRWSREQIKTLRSAYEQQMQSGGSGVLILGGQAQFEKLQITPREMEFSQIRDFVRASTIAAFGCVPVRLGLETANYSQSRNQLQLYWESLQGRAALVDSELTRLARMFDEDITIRHDFSEIESLQESRSERLDRVMEWSMLGVPVADAAAYEGFDDLPVPEEAEPMSTPEEGAETDPEATTGSETTDEPLAATALNGAQISSLLQILASVAQGAITFDSAMALIAVSFPTISEAAAAEILAGAQSVPDEAENATDEEVEEELMALARSIFEDPSVIYSNEMDAYSDEVWRRFHVKAQGPAEKEIQLSMLRYLKGYAARIARKLPQVLSQKAVGQTGTVIKAPVDDAWLDEVIDAYSEQRLMEEAMRPAIAAAWAKGAELAIGDMRSDLAQAFEHEPVDKEVDAHLGEMVTNVTDGTRTRVNAIVLDGLEAGATVNEIQQSLMQDRGFSAQRSLTIARTESTRAVNAAGVNAWEQMAAQLDMEVEFKWKSQPGARDAHKELNGKVRGEQGVEGHWVSGVASAEAPGQFGVASLDINCRCTYLPRVK